MDTLVVNGSRKHQKQKLLKLDLKQLQRNYPKCMHSAVSHML